MTTWSKQHPDLDEDGKIRLDTLVYTDPSTLDWERRHSTPVGRAEILAEAARTQAELPPVIQELVQGRVYGAGGTASAGYAEYLQTVERYKQDYASSLGYQHFVSDADVAKMSQAEFDRFFDDRGQPREGVYFHRTSRSFKPDSGMSNNARGELRRGGST